jgi:outer membrane protein assembly factor BamB
MLGNERVRAKLAPPAGRTRSASTIALMLLLSLRPTAQAPSGNWSQFRGSAHLTGTATTAPPATLTLKWTYEAGESIESSAAIVDGTVYVGSTKGELLAIDLERGKLRWKYTTGPDTSIGESSPAVSDGVVFVGDLAGTLHAVSAVDGKRLWTFATDGEVKSSPVVLDDVVLIGSYDTRLYALDRRTGKVRWRLQTDGPVHATPAVQDGVIYIAGCDERFRAVRAADGKVLFEIPLGSYTGASTVVEGERAYVGTFDADVFAIDLRKKKVAWRFRDPDRQFPYYSSAALDRTPTGGHIIVGGRDKAIRAIDTASGKTVWKLVTRARVDSSPAIAGGRVFVGSSDGKLYVLDAATGEKRWEFDAGDAITASPAIGSGRVVVGAQDGRVYCFG